MSKSSESNDIKLYILVRNMLFFMLINFLVCTTIGFFVIELGSGLTDRPSYIYFMCHWNYYEIAILVSIQHLSQRE